MTAPVSGIHEIVMVWHQGCHTTGFGCTCPGVAGKGAIAQEYIPWMHLFLLSAALEKKAVHNIV